MISVLLRFRRLLGGWLGAVIWQSGELAWINLTVPEPLPSVKTPFLSPLSQKEWMSWPADGNTTAPVAGSLVPRLIFSSP